MTEQTTGDLFTEAERRRDAGLQQVTDNEPKSWMERAKDAVRDLNQRREWTGEDIRLFVTESIGEPHHHNIWGALTSWGIKQGILQRTGEWRKMVTPKSHARMTPVYRVAGGS